MMYGRRPRLQVSFATAVDSDDVQPTGFWLQVEGCPNGPSWVEVEHSSDAWLRLDRGWKAFVRSRRLTWEQYLLFEYDGDAMLSVNIFSADGGCEHCCEESSSSGNGFNEEDEGEEDSPSVKVEEDSSSG